jgi:2-oxo-4-hydroxy-4-carboxy-5-ureidoimidazoline decarboxylase
MRMKLTIASLNALDRPRFIETLGWVFEGSPWVAERAWNRRPFENLDVLHAAMADEVASASTDEQRALLSAHPDLGTRLRMSEASTREQAGAALDELSEDEYNRLQELNTAYRCKFEFPFLFAVKGSTKHQILQALEARLPRTTDEECAEALRQVSRIARFRLEDLIER